MIVIDDLRFGGGSGHEHGVAVRWRELENGDTYVSRDELIELILRRGGEASRRDGAKVYVVPGAPSTTAGGVTTGRYPAGAWQRAKPLRAARLTARPKKRAVGNASTRVAPRPGMATSEPSSPKLRTSRIRHERGGGLVGGAAAAPPTTALNEDCFLKPPPAALARCSLYRHAQIAHGCPCVNIRRRHNRATDTPTGLSGRGGSARRSPHPVAVAPGPQ
jgi:hypothetical protein